MTNTVRPTPFQSPAYGSREQRQDGADSLAVRHVRKEQSQQFGRVAIAKEYLSNLKSLVAAVRKDTGVSGLPFLCGSVRRAEDPDNLSASVPERIAGPYPAIQWIVKAQWDPQKEIPHTNIVILRDIPSHPMNVHYNTAGQLQVGKLFADAYGRWASSGR